VQVVTSWLGNTPSVAMRHYLMTTDQHFDDAVSGARETAQQAHAGCRTERKRGLSKNDQTLNLPGFATNCDSVQFAEVAAEGFEPPTRGL
jgi:hypothetical protein